MKAITFNLLAWVMLPIMDGFAKYLSADLPVLQITWARYFFTVAFTFPVMFFFFSSKMGGQIRLRLCIDFNNNSSDNNFPILTEQINLSSLDIDSKSTIDIVNIFSEADKEPQKAVNNAIPELVQAIDEITLKLIAPQP